MRNAQNNGKINPNKTNRRSSFFKLCTIKVSIWVIGIGEINKGWAKGHYYLNQFEMQSTSWLAILKNNKVALIVVVKRHLPTTTLFNYLFAFHLHDTLVFRKICQLPSRTIRHIEIDNYSDLVTCKSKQMVLRKAQQWQTKCSKVPADKASEIVPYFSPFLELCESDQTMTKFKPTETNIKVSWFFLSKYNFSHTL